jgi:hypothetical protein
VLFGSFNVCSLCCYVAEFLYSPLLVYNPGELENVTVVEGSQEPESKLCTDICSFFTDKFIYIYIYNML